MGNLDIYFGRRDLEKLAENRAGRTTIIMRGRRYPRISDGIAERYLISCDAGTEATLVRTLKKNTDGRVSQI